MPNILNQKTKRNPTNNGNEINRDFDLMKFKESIKKEMESEKYKR